MISTHARNSRCCLITNGNDSGTDEKYDFVIALIAALNSPGDVRARAVVSLTMTTRAEKYDFVFVGVRAHACYN